MSSLKECFCNSASAAWDKVTKNSARLERGMEEASAIFLSPAVAAGLFSHQIYQEDGITGLAYMAVGLTAAWVAGIAAMSRLEIKEFDKEKHEEQVATALRFYTTNKDKFPAPTL